MGKAYSQSMARGPTSGFSILELVGVLIVIGIIAGIILTIGPGAINQSNIDRAEADIHVIQQALESYRAHYGDYPRVPADYAALAPVTDDAQYLLNALNGQIGPTGQPITANWKSMLNNSLLKMENSGLPLASLQANRILDPWFIPYVYDYRPGDPAWTQYGYILYSKGPDGADGTLAADADNIVAK